MGSSNRNSALYMNFFSMYKTTIMKIEIEFHVAKSRASFLRQLYNRVKQVFLQERSQLHEALKAYFNRIQSVTDAEMVAQVMNQLFELGLPCLAFQMECSSFGFINLSLLFFFSISDLINKSLF